MFAGWLLTAVLAVALITYTIHRRYSLTAPPPVH
jgi:hypothetical protein